MLTDIDINDTSFAQACNDALVGGYGYFYMRDIIDANIREIASILAVPADILYNEQQTGHTVSELIAAGLFYNPVHEPPTISFRVMDEKICKSYMIKKYRDIYSDTRERFEVLDL